MAYMKVPYDHFKGIEVENKCKVAAIATINRGLVQQTRPRLIENERETFNQTEKEIEHQKQMVDSISASPNAITQPQKHGDCALNQIEQ